MNKTQKALEAAGVVVSSDFIARYQNDPYVYNLANLLLNYVDRVAKLEAEVVDLKKQVMCACSAHKNHSFCSTKTCSCPTLKRGKIHDLGAYTLHCGHPGSNTTLYWDRNGHPCCRDCWLNKGSKREDK